MALYCAVQKNSVPAAAGAVATSHTVFLRNRVLDTVVAPSLKAQENGSIGFMSIDVLFFR